MADTFYLKSVVEDRLRKELQDRFRANSTNRALGLVDALASQRYLGDLMKLYAAFLLVLSISGCAQNKSGGTINDEQAVRQWFDTYLKSTRSGDIDTVLSLIADDAVFLAPNNVRMDKKTFAAAVTMDPDNSDFKVEVKSEIEEIRIAGDLAYLWSQTEVTLTPTGGQSSRLSGHSLSILQKLDGKWLIIRDANTITPAKE